MTTSRSFSNQFEVTDYTQELNLIPNTWGLINELGIFSEEGTTQNTVTLESKAGTVAVVNDQKRGTRAQVGKDDVSTIRAFATTHHPYDDALFASELQGRRAYGTQDQPDTEANAIYTCNAEPATYTAATTTNALGSATGGNFPGIGAPAAGTPNGRQVTVNAVTNGSVIATGTASHYAIVDTVNSRLLATSSLTATQAVTSGNTIS